MGRRRCELGGGWKHIEGGRGRHGKKKEKGRIYCGFSSVFMDED